MAVTPISQSKPFLSIVVPIGSRNGDLSALESWIDKALQMKIEVILVLDESDQQTKQTFLKLISKKRSSLLKNVSGLFRCPGKARNAGLELATGKWIGFWDCDDIPFVDTYLSMALQADELQKDLAIGGFNIHHLVTDQRITHSAIPKNGESMEFLLCINPGLWRFAFRKDLIKNSKFSNLRMGEDQLFLAELQFSMTKAHIIANAVYEYRVGDPLQLTMQRNLSNEIEEFLERLLFVNQKNRNNKLLRYFILKQSYSLAKRVDLLRALQILFDALKLIGFRELFNVAKSYFKTTTLSWKPNHTLPPRIALVGGLGNQLFEIASGLFVAKNQTLEIDSSFEEYRKDKNGKSQIEKFILPSNVVFLTNSHPGRSRKKAFNLLLRISTLKNGPLQFVLTKACMLAYSFFSKRKLFINRGIGLDSRIIQLEQSVFMVGYFQNQVVPSFDTVREKMMSIELKEQSESFVDLKQIACRRKILVVHIRRGDYKKEKDFGLLGSSYYRDAFIKLNAASYDELWLFSDEADEALRLISEHENLPKIVRNNFEITAEETLQLMRYGSGFVIANSTFSWWAAFLKFDKNAPVVAPSPWYKGRQDPDRMCPTDWVMVKNE